MEGLQGVGVPAARPRPPRTVRAYNLPTDTDRQNAINSVLTDR
ncbi:MAG TPA: hypothetical protein VI248_18310 [Kineosporiaceae bacterium]